MSKNRISWIDIARGIGIILVVYGHALSAGPLRSIIYSFHMPLFFFLSGLVFKYRKEESWSAFLHKNARNILLPYLLFAVLSYLLWFLTKHPTSAQLLLQFGSIFYGNGNNNLLAFNNLLWFLPCLFLTRVIFFALTRKIHTQKPVALSLFVFSLVGYGYSLAFPNLKLPFGAETALIAIVFLGAGYLWTTQALPEKPHVWHMIKTHPRVLATVVALFLLVVCISIALYSMSIYGLQFDLRQDKMHNYLYFNLAAFSGILAMIFVSIAIKSNRLLEYLGKQSLVIFAWHLQAFPYVSRFLFVAHLKPFLVEAPRFISPIVYSIISTIIVLALAVPMQYITRHLSARKSSQ